MHLGRLDCCSRRRSDPIISCCSRWRCLKDEKKCADIERLMSVRELMAKQRQELAKLEVELQSKLKSLNSHNESLEKINTEIQCIDDKQEEVKKLVSSEDSAMAEFEAMRQSLAQRTQEQLENIAHRKQSLTLDLKGVRGSEAAEEKKTTDLSSHDTYHTAISDCPPGDKSSWDDDGFTDASRCNSDSDECAAALGLLKIKQDEMSRERTNKEDAAGTNGHPGDSENKHTSENSDDNVGDIDQNGLNTEMSQCPLDSSEIKEDSANDSDCETRSCNVSDSQETVVPEGDCDVNNFQCPDSEERELGEGQSVSPRDSRREDILLGVDERVVEGRMEAEVMAVENGVDSSPEDGEKYREFGVGVEREEKGGDVGRKNGVGKEIEMKEVIVEKGRNGQKCAIDGVNGEQSVIGSWNFAMSNGLTIGKAEEAMRRLCKEVERQKALVLQSLQNNCDKEEINRQISVLQELQRHYVRLEYAMESPTASSPVRSKGAETDGEGCDSDSGHIVAHEMGDSRNRGFTEDRHDQEGNLLNGTSSSSMAINGIHCGSMTNCYCICNGDCLPSVRPTGSQSARGSFSDMRVRSPSNPAIYRSLSIHGHPRLSYGNLSLGRSMSYSSSLLTPISMDESDPTGSGCGVWIHIPTYHLRGSGSSTHYEYEIKVAMEGEMWTLLRRYRRFRQLHLSLKAKYGQLVERIPFPPRKFFGKNLESVAKTRRKLLEVYLRHLLSVCCQIESCPLYSCRENPSRLALYEFSSFFRISIFDTGKFGTG
ncbi:hypothetical protein J437_LFUL002130 [Ladona fulva]|uniref:PX domain-containing protein n=1 Tax=Ladona fulva TaxID=123851 RepID=A0A8K0JXP2_LADFU|nr:hypothetical protein J437_LFUL002130 [Ladona fulva]